MQFRNRSYFRNYILIILNYKNILLCMVSKSLKMYLKPQNGETFLFHSFSHFKAQLLFFSILKNYFPTWTSRIQGYQKNNVSS
jgi:hypothetical protein